MYVALDKEGLRVYIEEAEKNEDYFCPVCRGKLRVRKGDIREHHFAHLSGVCEDNWNYDMSEWHMEWQERFPKECREVVITFNGVKHRADVLNGKTVIEFQHSQMSFEEFNERNSFYTKAGYKLVWLFDMQDLYENGYIYNNPRKDDDNSWIWNWSHSTFYRFQPKEQRNIFLFFQFEERTILHVKWFPTGNTKYFITDDVDFWSIKDVEKALSEFREQRKETGYCIADLYDPVYSHGTDAIERQEDKVLNCPIGEATIDNCCLCPFFQNGVNCTGKFIDILKGWNNETDKVFQIKRDEYDIIREVTALKAGKKIKRSYNAAKVGYSLFELVYNTGSICIIVKNVRTGYQYKIGTRYYQQHRNIKNEGKYRKNDSMCFSETRNEIYYANKPEWVVIWRSTQQLNGQE